MWEIAAMHSRILCASLAALFGAVLAVSQSGCQRAESTPLAGDGFYEMDVPDMVCEGCAIGITEALQKVEGVEEVEVLVSKKQVRVGVATAVLKDEVALSDAVKKAGYEVKAFAKGQ